MRSKANQKRSASLVGGAHGHVKLFDCGGFHFHRVWIDYRHHVTGTLSSGQNVLRDCFVALQERIKSLSERLRDLWVGQIAGRHVFDVFRAAGVHLAGSHNSCHVSVRLAGERHCALCADFRIIGSRFQNRAALNLQIMVRLVKFDQLFAVHTVSKQRHFIAGWEIVVLRQLDANNRFVDQNAAANVGAGCSKHTRRDIRHRRDVDVSCFVDANRRAGGNQQLLQVVTPGCDRQIARNRGIRNIRIQRVVGTSKDVCKNNRSINAGVNASVVTAVQQPSNNGNSRNLVTVQTLLSNTFKKVFSRKAFTVIEKHFVSIFERSHINVVFGKIDVVVVCDKGIVLVSWDKGDIFRIYNADQLIDRQSFAGHGVRCEVAAGNQIAVCNYGVVNQNLVHGHLSRSVRTCPVNQ